MPKVHSTKNKDTRYNPNKFAEVIEILDETLLDRKSEYP